MENRKSLYTLSKMIDHSLLHPTLTDAAILSGCRTAREYDTATVCVKPYSIEICRETLLGSEVGICAVIGFPHGNSTTSIKTAETIQAIEDGASEIDMVVNIGKVLGGEWPFVKNDIQEVNQVCIGRGAILKVIFETDYLEDEHIIKLCQICSDLEVAFIKTSSGYGFVKQSNGDYNYQGATDHNLALMRRHAAPQVQIKAAGGVRTLADLLRVQGLGASRVGATATQAILEEAKAQGWE